MKYLRNFDVGGKLVLLRSDINSDVVNGRVINNLRIREAASTISLLKKKGAMVVVLAHQGNRGKRDFIGLRQHSRLLNKYTRVRFIDDIIGKKAIASINKLKLGEAILLENIRFHKDEIANPRRSNKLLDNLVPLFDLYINDAFSASHRNHTSITGFAKKIPCCAGPLVEKELLALKKLKLKNALFILGGGKPESNIKLHGRGRKVIDCGFFGQMVLISRGQDLGYQNKYLKKEALVKGDWNSFLKKVKRKSRGAIIPIDFAVNVNGRRVEYPLEDFPINYRIDDIGEETIKLFKKEIAKARAIYMKGPAGYSGNPIFAKGTVELLKAIRRAKAYSVVGGGHLSDAILKYKISKKGFGHVSLSGGALLDYIAGEKLVGLEVLK